MVPTALKTLQHSCIIVAIWSCLFSIIQVAIMGWQIGVLKTIKWRLDNRQLPLTSGIDPFRATFPGLYARYTETPERRRMSTLLVIAVINLIVSLVHLILSCFLFYGCIKKRPNSIWPWLLSVIVSIVVSIAYSIIWWIGDAFNEQLIVLIAEFVMAIPINSIALMLIIIFYAQLSGVNLYGECDDISPKAGEMKMYQIENKRSRRSPSEQYEQQQIMALTPPLQTRKPKKCIIQQHKQASIHQQGRTEINQL